MIQQNVPKCGTYALCIKIVYGAPVFQGSFSLLGNSDCHFVVLSDSTKAGSGIPTSKSFVLSNTVLQDKQMYFIYSCICPLPLSRTRYGCLCNLLKHPSLEHILPITMSINTSSKCVGTANILRFFFKTIIIAKKRKAPLLRTPQ